MHAAPGRPALSRNKLARRSRSAAGFTLVEVGVALALLALTAALVIPELGQITDANVRSQGNAFIGAIEYANTQAVTRRRYYRLYFDLDKNTYWVAARNEKGHFRPLEFDPLGSERPLLDGVEFKDVFIIDTVYKKGVTYAELLPDGTMDPMLIHLDSYSGDEYTVEIDDYVSSAEVFPGYTEPKDYSSLTVKFAE